MEKGYRAQDWVVVCLAWWLVCGGQTNTTTRTVWTVEANPIMPPSVCDIAGRNTADQVISLDYW